MLVSKPRKVATEPPLMEQPANSLQGIYESALGIAPAGPGVALIGCMIQDADIVAPRGEERLQGKGLENGPEVFGVVKG